MNEDLQQLLLNLKLHVIAERLEEYLTAAEREGTPPATLLTQLMRAEWEARQQAALDARLRRARIPERWTLETFPFKVQTGVKERQIRTLAELSFIPKAENIVFIGETGVGKTGLMSALVLKAVQNGYRALFIRAQDLFDEMYASLADRSTRKLLRSLANVDVLAVDELGYLNVKPEQTNIFFKLMEERHHRKPTLLTTNMPYPAWQDFLGNKPLTQALLSRLRERCHTVTIDGPCLRAQQG
ncbi:MAG TPA: IS21-like element helper ATPase IstB [Polyangiaceae bacterium]|nr:IS21-like element helper ATPase IstB [Polyangiaceae bacterium]